MNTVERVARLHNPIALTATIIAGVSRGAYYWDQSSLTEGSVKAVNLLDSWLPLQVYAALWIGASLLLAVGIATNDGLAKWAGSLVVAMWGLWGITFIISFFVNESPAAFTTGCGFIAIAAVTVVLVDEERETVVEEWAANG